MVQVLCHLRGLNTCWRPSSIATRVVALGNGVGYITIEGVDLGSDAPYSAVRFL